MSNNQNEMNSAEGSFDLLALIQEKAKWSEERGHWTSYMHIKADVLVANLAQFRDLADGDFLHEDGRQIKVSLALQGGFYAEGTNGADLKKGLRMIFLGEIAKGIPNRSEKGRPILHRLPAAIIPGFEVCCMQIINVPDPLDPEGEEKIPTYWVMSTGFPTKWSWFTDLAEAEKAQQELVDHVEKLNVAAGKMKTGPDVGVTFREPAGRPPVSPPQDAVKPANTGADSEEPTPAPCAVVEAPSPEPPSTQAPPAAASSFLDGLFEEGGGRGYPAKKGGKKKEKTK